VTGPTIRRQKERGTGLLNNELYIGEMVWNRCSYVKDPRTGKRVARPNPVSQWERMQVPDLRIISDELWQAAKRRQELVTFAMERNEDGHALNRSHRRRYLLSGLLICGCCGGNFSIVTRDTYSCSGRRAKGVCSNDRTISREEIESRILTAIKQNLLTPELVAEFTRAYTQEFNRLVAEAGSQHAEVAGKLTAVERKIAGIMWAIGDGLYQPAKARLAELEAEKARRRRAARRGDGADPLDDRQHHADAARKAADWTGCSALIRLGFWRCARPAAVLLALAPNGKKPPALVALGGFECRWLRGQDLNL
jgi:site-specific DNA recombinase